jgi:hypothetical protein
MTTAAAEATRSIASALQQSAAAAVTAMLTKQYYF